MPNNRKIKKAVRELSTLRHRANSHLYDRKAQRRKLRIAREYGRLKALESEPAPVQAKSEKT
jgi:hypothetical protein